MSAEFRPITEQDIHLLREGTHGRLYDKLGSHPAVVDGVSGVHFAVWAPNARSVSVIGDFNDWTAGQQLLRARPHGSGVWEAFVPGVGRGARYKYHIDSSLHGYSVDKGDPFAFAWECPPGTASRVWVPEYDWGDSDWMQRRRTANALDAPVSIYEVHLGSWRRMPEDGARPLTYRELAEQLPAYVSEMGFTHVEILPVTEHPFYGSWGYQCTGYFAPTARFGPPEDFMALVDALHRAGVGVILDWVPSHFPGDEHGLAYFDGTWLFEHADPKQGYHPDWNSYIFNYSRNEVRSFLLSSALFWLDRYHADGLRVDAVASMLYLDYGRKEGEWIPNEYGGKENIAAIGFLRMLNDAVCRDYPDALTIAEESTAWPMVSRPVYAGGLGFGMKWNMGWMHDTLDYFSRDPLYRKYHHDRLTFSLWYAYHENFVLPLSHDEVVHGKRSLAGRMPGDEWQRLANLRLLYGYMWGHPGKKLLFMGGELGSTNEWWHESSLDWHLLGQPLHAGLQRWVRDLNTFYRGQPALSRRDFSSEGFQWVDCHDWEESVISFLRSDGPDGEWVLVVCNFTPVVRRNYTVGVPRTGFWRESLNSDAPLYGGSGQGNLGGLEAAPIPSHGQFHSLTITLPPLAALYFTSSPESGDGDGA